MPFDDQQAGVHPFAIYLMGPTASGKTDLAIELCKHFPCDIISVDSALIYRGMNIGTAKPDAQTLEKAPHKLIDILEPEQAYSAAQFRVDALREMEASIKQGRIPLLVGGTMLYFRALEKGLATLPEADPEIRERLNSKLESEGLASMHKALQGLDPESATRIHPNDPQRILRALEIYYASGEPMSAHLARQASIEFPYRVLKVVISPLDRRLLHERIASRFTRMLELGFLDEVKTLRQRSDLDLDKPSMRCVGYRQIWRHLDGDYDFETMIEKGIIATRQLAKRQLTWLRSESGAHWFDAENLVFADINNKIERYIT